jgi:aminomuconate-semialdehyde/2-hydroxymuconate-6-semialdehyde dehydrogenase
MMQLLNYIGGQFLSSHSNKTMYSINPSIGKVHAELPDSDADDVQYAVEKAKEAFKKWSQTSHEERFKYLNKIAELIEDRIEELAMAESIDNGKPLWLAKKVDIPRASSNFRFFATAAMQFASESHEMPNRAINYTLRKPIGIVGCISPWNLPLYLFTWKIAPALATGNVVIAKPSEITPYTAHLLAEICHDAGLPTGVINILHGRGGACGEAIIRHPDIKAISFTGGTHTGARIAGIAGPMFKKMSLELGGKNPNLIFADADMPLALATTVRSSFSNQGQICLCGSRILIESSIYDDFVAEFIPMVEALKVGDPLDPQTQIGALVSAEHLAKIDGYVRLAVEEGGSILTGGQIVSPEGRCAEGYFYTPTVIANLDNHCRVNQEEIFGPVVTLQPFNHEEEAIALANGTPYGLAATIWTQDLNRAHRLSDQIEAGIIWVNCWLERDLRTPFGGVKASGVGREGGWEAMRFFTEPKNVCIQWNT